MVVDRRIAHKEIPVVATIRQNSHGGASPRDPEAGRFGIRVFVEEEHVCCFVVSGRRGGTDVHPAVGSR
jgi:hypothetical protein